MDSIRLEDLTWVDIGKKIQSGYKTVVFGLGSSEQHGPHLPEKTDSLLAETITNRVALKLENALQAPTIRIGCSDHHLDFPGTISLKSSTLKAVITDYIISLVNHRFTKIILIPFHGGNFKPTADAIAELAPKYPNVKILGITDLDKFVTELIRPSIDTGLSKEEAGIHAGENETSMVLATESKFVRKDRFTEGFLGELGKEEINKLFKDGLISLTDIGVLGDPRSATAEKGEIYLQNIVDFLIREIQITL
ncbi:MAG: creatininase family protein [Candidatus Heimdallarchaeota archaeon]|nr:creatininase family protein [Candidatus Heimdallarchaeota archaeon]